MGGFPAREAELGAAGGADDLGLGLVPEDAVAARAVGAVAEVGVSLDEDEHREVEVLLVNRLRDEGRDFVFGGLGVAGGVGALEGGDAGVVDQGGEVALHAVSAVAVVAAEKGPHLVGGELFVADRAGDELIRG